MNSEKLWKWFPLAVLILAWAGIMIAPEGVNVRLLATLYTLMVFLARWVRFAEQKSEVVQGVEKGS